MSEMPDVVVAASAVFSTPTRVLVLHLCSQGQGKTISEIGELADVNRSTITATVRILELHEVLVGSPPPGKRLGEIVWWRTDATRVSTLLEALQDFLEINEG